MEHFNLKEYLADPSKKVITREGLNARIICINRKDLEYQYPIIALIETESGEESIQDYTKDGKYHIADPCKYDLFFAPKRHEGWINIYKDDKNFKGARIYSSEKEAFNASKHLNDYITTTKIEWEE